MRYEETEDVEPARRLLFVLIAYAVITLVGACAFYLVYTAIAQPSKEVGQPGAVSTSRRTAPAAVDAFYGDRHSLSAIDPAAYPRLAISLGSPADWFSSNDYPLDAQAQSREGSARAKFVIGVDGHISKCRIIESAGWTSLDTTTCRLLASRARFLPARDSAGATKASTETRRVTWRLPQ